MDNNSQSEAEIREVIKKWSADLKHKDIEAMHENYADDYRIYDVGCTVEGVEGVKELWRKCMPYFDEPEVVYRDMVIQANGDMAFVYFKSQIHGVKGDIPEEMKNGWIRGTICFRKENGVWKCCHEHISFPVDCEKNTTIFEE